MDVYTESGKLLDHTPDLDKGWLSEERQLIAHHPAVPAKHRRELLAGTRDLYHLIVTVPAEPAWDEYKEYKVYHPYPAENRPAASLEQRVEKLERAVLGGKNG